MNEPTSETSQLLKTSSRPAHQKRVEEYETDLHTSGREKNGIIQTGSDRSLLDITREARSIVARDLLVERANTKREKAEGDSVMDSLTKTLFNRRGYEQRLKQEVARAKRDGTPLVLFLSDVRGLGNMNNAYSMEAGDVLLKATAEDLKSETREGDTIARWGGDEFGVLLPNTSLKDAETVCNRMVEELAKNHVFEFTHKGEKTALEGPIGFRGAIGLIDPNNPDATELAIKEMLSEMKNREKKEGRTGTKDSIVVLRNTEHAAA